MIVSKTRDKRIPEDCKLCKYFRLKVRPRDELLGICEVTYEQLIRDDKGELKKSDFCPFTGVMIHV